MKLFKSLDEALKPKKDIKDAKVIHFKVPVLEKEDRIDDIKFNRESKFKKMTDDKLFFSPKNEGFFFAYNPSTHKYFESNASFSFIASQMPRQIFQTRRYSTSYTKHKFDVIAEPNVVGYKGINFRVVNSDKKIYMEKVFGGDTSSRVVSNPNVNSPDSQMALEIAVMHHPELADYTFAPKKMKVKDMGQIGIESLRSGKEINAYIALSGEDYSKAKKDGIKGKTTLYLEKKVAIKEAKWRIETALRYVWVVAEVKIADPNAIEKDDYDLTYTYTGDIKASDIKAVKTNNENLLKSNYQFQEYTKNKHLWDLRVKHVVIAKDEDEYSYFLNRTPVNRFTKRGRSKGSRVRKQWPTYSDKVIMLMLDSRLSIFLFSPGATEIEVEEFLGFLKLYDNKHNLYGLPPELTRDKYLKEHGYNIVFKHKFPREWEKEMIKVAFSEETYKINKLGKLLEIVGINETK